MGGYPIPGPGRGYPITSLGRAVPSPRSGGYPIPGWGGTPSQVRGTPSLFGGTWGTPEPGLNGVPPNQVLIRQSSISSTCYATGSVPLAFTQEDFLVA